MATGSFGETGGSEYHNLSLRYMGRLCVHVEVHVGGCVCLFMVLLFFIFRKIHPLCKIFSLS